MASARNARPDGKKKGTIRTDFRGLITLLAKNLYTQEDAFIRELVQNAHDAIVVREDLEAAAASRIQIFADRDARMISFHDNGSGMTEKEITDYLAVIGRSGTGDLRVELSKRDRQRAQALIGQFGIGILSAFVVAEKLVVETLSVRAGHGGLRWTALGDPDYELEYIEKEEVGTTVTVHLRPQYLGMTNPETVLRAVRKYADFLPFPIYVNDQGPVNTMQAPWDRSYANEAEREKAYWNWANERFPDVPLLIIPVDMETPQAVRGLLYVSNRRIPDVDMAGMVDIYQARMFVRQGDRNILPGWAKFVAGVIDSPALTPTAARDAVREDECHRQIRAALGRLIIDALKRLATVDRTRFRRLMEWHHYHIKGMAVQFDDFFDAIADSVLFEVSLAEVKEKGRAFQMMTLPEYMAAQSETDPQGRKFVYFISGHGAAPQFYRLCQAKGLLAVNAGLVFEEEFLRKYAAVHDGSVCLQRVDVEGTAIFEPLSEAERLGYVDTEYRLRVLLRATLPDQETIVQTERFAPASFPAVLTQTKDDEVAKRLELLANFPSISPVHSEAMREALGIQRNLLRPIVLHLNAGSPVVDRLRREDFDDPATQQAWLTLYNNAFFYSQQYLTAQNLEVLHAQTVRVLEDQLTLREEQRRLRAQVEEVTRSTGPSPLVRRTVHTSLFVMMPFGEEYDVLEGALRAVFEDEPYYFQVILARDRTRHQELLPNLKAHMRLVHGFVADVSDLNPNVILELGMTAVDSEDRPVVILHRTGSSETPADLRGRLYVEYDLPPAEEADRAHILAAQLRNRLGDVEVLEGLCQTRAGRFLSVTHLLRKLGHRILPDEAERISRAFERIEEIEKVDKNSIATKAGVEPTCAAVVVQCFQGA